MRRVLLISLALGLGCGDSTPTATSSLSMWAEAGLPAQSPASAPVAQEVAFYVTTGGGGPAQGLGIDVRVAAGGGSISPERPTTDADGRAALTWTLGPAPVLGRLEARVGAASAEVEIVGTLAEPLVPEAFGDVNAFLGAAGDPEGSTEGLAFDGTGRLLLSAPGRLLALDPAGGATDVTLSGDALEAPLGLAPDGAGGVWVADSAGALRRVDAGGQVSTALLAVDGAPLLFPNAVVVGPDGLVYLSDSCRGEILRFDPAPDGAAPAVVATTNLQTEGGPNGLAFDGGGRLWFTTMNTVLLCGTEQVQATDQLAGLWRADRAPGGFAEPVAIATGMGLIGDGLVFDREDNAYVIFDEVAGLSLDASVLWVYPAGGLAPVQLVRDTEQLLASLAFGRGDFGETTLYVALVTAIPFTPASARGVLRLELGLRGQETTP